MANRKGLRAGVDIGPRGEAMTTCDKWASVRKLQRVTGISGLTGQRVTFWQCLFRTQEYSVWSLSCRCDRWRKRLNAKNQYWKVDAWNQVICFLMHRLPLKRAERSKWEYLFNSLPSQHNSRCKERQLSYLWQTRSLWGWSQVAGWSPTFRSNRHENCEDSPLTAQMHTQQRRPRPAVLACMLLQTLLQQTPACESEKHPKLWQMIYTS